MPRWLRSEGRGQTEPIPALVAVAAVCLGVSLYAGYAADSLMGTNDRSVEETTLDTVWMELGDDGLYDPTEGALQTLSHEPLPDGYHVHVTVAVEDGRGNQQVVDRTRIDAHSDGDPGPPVEDAMEASRAVPVADERLSGKIRTGTLRVEVWQ